LNEKNGYFKNEEYEKENPSMSNSPEIVTSIWGSYSIFIFIHFFQKKYFNLF